LIRGTGIDIISVQRIRESIEQHGQRFLDRLFTAREQAYCQGRADPALHYAGRFAAKEAIYKALSSLGGPVPLIELEILNRENGQPYLELGLTLAKRWQSLPVTISISHCKEYATALAILE
jgi:holo-[acyl-carrier protein] synthase